MTTQTSPATSAARLVFVSGSGATDSANATVSSPLVVAVQAPDGSPAAGAAVRFETTLAGLNAGSFVSDLSSSGYATLLTVLTDSLGRAAVRVRFDSVAGTTSVRVSVTGLQLRDSASFTVSPGSPFRIVKAPTNPVVVPDRMVQLQCAATDRWGNVRQDAVQFSTSGLGAAVSISGLVHSISPGRTWVYLAADGVRDSIPITVVPLATLAATRRAADTGDTLAVVTLNTENPGWKVIGPISMDPSAERGPSWAPSGDRIVFHQPLTYYFDVRLFTMDLQGNATQLIVPTSSLQSESFAQYSYDGAWIYFSGRPGSQNSEVWRVAANGTGAQRITAAADFGSIESRPSPSPDGNQVVYYSTRDPLTIHILDLRTGAVRILGAGFGPRWSPDGSRIAAITTSGILILSVDGTKQQLLGTPGTDYTIVNQYPTLDWSPDSKWIAVRGISGIELIEVATNMVVQLPGTAKLIQPSWRPVP